MAANYWESTQRRYWQFSKDELAQMRDELEKSSQMLVQMFPLPRRPHLNIYFNQQLGRLAKRLSVKQQAVATAQLYMKRFYCKVDIRRTNPYLLLTTALYIACKMEECPQHIRMFVSEARSLWPDLLHADVSRVGECEFFLISEMNSQLIVHQPYRTLTALQSDFSLSQDEINLALAVINDHYMTDLPLLYPPHTIALTAILLSLIPRPNNNTNMAAVTAALTQAQQSLSGTGTGQNTPRATEKDKQPDMRMGKMQRFVAFLAESTVDIEGMIDCTQELISFYECHEQYNDKITREQVNRFVKARGMDRH
ncbi:cyclin-like protein [Daldinia sp. FL1419]|nr:cyclin-like protein [Daldinia sp. FL1419]